MKTKFIPLAFAAAALFSALPASLSAADGTAPAPTPAVTPGAPVGKKHRDINAWLDDHPKIKAKVLARFDTNHNGALDGDEIKAFLKWRKERREAKRAEGGGKAGQNNQTTTTSPAITSPTVQ